MQKRCVDSKKMTKWNVCLLVSKQAKKRSIQNIKIETWWTGGEMYKSSRRMYWLCDKKSKDHIHAIHFVFGAHTHTKYRVDF